MSTDVFAKLVVIFLVVAVGWVAGKRIPGQDAARAIAGIAFYVFVPALLFRTTARIDFARLDSRILFSYFVPVLAIIGIVYAIGRWHERRHPGPPAEAAVRAISVNFGNTVQIGIPLAAAIFGETGLAIHVTILSLHALVILTTLTVLVEVDLARAARHSNPHEAAHLRHVIASTAKNTVIHPVVLPVLAGLTWNAAGLPLPGFADEALQLLGQGVVPVCLVLIGLSLAAYGVHGSLRVAAVVAALKLLVVPAAVLVVSRWGFGLTGLPLSVVVLMSSLPVGSNALLFAQRYRTLEAETTAAIVISTVAFIVTCPIWLTVLQAMR